MTVWTVLHEMTPEIISDDEEIWNCSECGRRLQFVPDFEILMPGDEQVAHFGSAGGLRIAGLSVSQKESKP